MKGPAPLAPRRAWPVLGTKLTPRQLYRWREYLTSYTMIAPFYIIFAVFGFIPLVFSFYLSFQDWNLLSPMRFVGLRNYVHLLTSDPLFRTALYNTAFIGVIAGPLVVGGAHVSAFILNLPRLRFRSFFRAAYFLPVLVSSVAVGIIFSVLFATRFGLINALLQALGLERVNWLGGSGHGIKPVIIILNMWRWTGWNMILVTAALQAIPQELFEAAEIDGADRFHIFKDITIPLLAPISLYILITAISGTVQMFDEAFIIAGNMGGIDNQGLTLAMYMYANAFSFMKLGYASALGYVMAFLIFGLSFIAIRRYFRARSVRVKEMKMITSRRSGLTPGQRIGRTASATLMYTILTVTALVALFPVYWMAVLGTLDKDQVMTLPPHFLPGNSLGVNLAELVDRIPYVRNYANSLIVALSQSALVLLLSSLAGFAFAKRQFPAKNFLFMFMLGTMFIPHWAGLVPWFLIIKQLGMIDKLYGIILPGAVSAIGVFWMRQAISQSIPDELLDAARIDGSSTYGMFFRIVLPIVRPALGALAIMTFMGSWNNFLGPLIILQSTENFTLPITLRTLLGTTGTRPTPWGAMMAGTSLATLPIVIIFVFSSKQFISGLMAGALKG